MMTALKITADRIADCGVCSPMKSIAFSHGSVEPNNLPNMYKLKTEGVDFTNSHSLFPTITTVSASAIATGHYIGDTGDFGNTLHTGVPMQSAKGSTIAGLENNAVLAEMNQKFGGKHAAQDKQQHECILQKFFGVKKLWHQHVGIEVKQADPVNTANDANGVKTSQAWRTHLRRRMPCLQRGLQQVWQ